MAPNSQMSQTSHDDLGTVAEDQAGHSLKAVRPDPVSSVSSMFPVSSDREHIATTIAATSQSSPTVPTWRLRLKHPRLLAGLLAWASLAGLVLANSQQTFNRQSASDFEFVPPTTQTIRGVLQQNYEAKLEQVAAALDARALLPEEPARGIILHEVSEGETLWQLTQMYQLDAAAIATSNGINAQTELEAGQKLYIPRTEGLVYTVKAGDTLETIARAHQVSQSAIIASTPLTNAHFLRIGQRLVIPGSVSDILAVRRQAAEAEAARIARAEAERQAARVARGQLQTYTVQPGDTLIGLASRYRMSASQLVSANPGVSARRLQIGQRLTIPGQGGAFAAATPTAQQSYRIQPGDTLGTIARRYNVSVNSLVRANPNVRATRLQVGRTLSIPSSHASSATVATSLPPAPVTSSGFAWPVSGRINSGFGWRWGRMHNGVDIPGPVGSPVVAVREGRVIYSGWHAGGYGNLIKIRHPDGSVTLYAHGTQRYVSYGQAVSRGQVIMSRGSTGWSTGPHLHFEVHVNGSPVNPLPYLR